MFPPSTPLLSAGAQVGRYRIEAFVAKGGMGEIYRAWDQQLERVVALKSVRPDHALEAETLARFEREAQLLARVNHHGICQIFDVLRHEGQMVLAMEWVDGQPLSAHISQARIPWRAAVPLIRGIARALHAAHAKGVIHRDLKPSNVMVLPDGQVKVLDFGLAKAIGEHELSGQSTQSMSAPVNGNAPVATPERFTQAGMLMGTLAYLAPELVAGQRASEASDLWSLGVIFHEMLTGALPYEGMGVMLLRNLQTGQRAPVPLPRLPHALHRTLDSLLDRNPHRRMKVGELLDAMDALTRPRTPFVWAGGAAALTLTLGGLGLWTFGRGAIPEFSTRRKARIVVAPLRNLSGDLRLAIPVGITTRELLEQTLRRIPNVRIVEDRRIGAEAHATRPLEAALPERTYLEGVVARTGADFVLLGEVRRTSPSAPPTLAFRLVDRTGTIRTQEELASHLPEFDPHEVVPRAFQALSQRLLALGRSGEPLELPSREAILDYGEGLAALREGDTARSLPLLERAAARAPRFAPAVYALGCGLYRMGDARAHPTFQWSRALYRESGDRIGQGQALLNLAFLAHRGGDDAAEEAYLREVLTTAEGCEDQDLQAAALENLAVLDLDRGRVDAAKARLDRALGHVTDTGNRHLRSAILIDLANLAKKRRQSFEARRLYSEAAEDARITGEVDLASRARNNLAILELEQGLIAQAERTLLEVLALRRERGDVEGEARVLLNLGIAAYMQEALGRARERFQAALELARRHQLLLVEGRALYRLGDVARTQGRWPEARARFEACLPPLTAKGTPENQADAHALLAECLLQGPDGPTAERHLRAARELQPDNPLLLRAQAWQAWKRGERGRALAFLAQALEAPDSDDPEHRNETRKLLTAWKSRP